MKNRYVAILLFLMHASLVFSQGIKDSVFQIQPVQVTAKQIFKKEEAGMKETKVDTFIMIEKVNLSLSELLSENTPVFIKNHGRGALATASFRGTAASHTQINWNGININSPMAGMVDFSLIPVYIIDDLNLKHGMASISDQSGGLGGSININNTVNWDNAFRFRLMQGIGSYNTFDEFLKISFGNKRIQFKTRIYHNYSKNNFTFINRGIANIDPITGEITNPLDTNKNADYTKYGMLQEIYARPGEKSVVSLKYWGQSAYRTIPRATSYEGPNNSNLNRQRDNDHKILADWKRFGENNKLVLRSAWTTKQLDYTLKNHVPGIGFLPAINSKSTQSSYLNAVSYAYNFRPDFSMETKLDANYHDVRTTEEVKNTGYEKERFEFFSFLSIQKSIEERLNLKLMLRQEWIDKNRNPLIPYFGFDYRLTEKKDLYLKGNIAKNYHQPSLNDLYWQPGGNLSLLPEEGVSYELGVEFKTSKSHNRLSTEITAYRSDIDNWIIWLPSYKGYWEPQNIKKVLSQGIEVNTQIDGEYNNIRYKLAGSYAYTSSVNYGDPLRWGDQSRGKQLVYVPLHSGNLMVNISFKKYSLTYQHNSYSERFTTSNNDISKRDWLYPYFMNDLILSKDFKVKKIKISTELKVYNLFNERYHSVLYRPMPGRNYLFLLMVDF